MPEEYFMSEDIPVARRRAKDLRIHRNVRRDILPDYISKRIVASESYNDTFFFLDYSNTKANSRKTFPAMEKPDPFGMRTFYLKYSMNKKYRWELDEELSENIYNYQDEVLKLRTSYLRTVIEHTNWLWKYGYRWIKRYEKHAVEFATVRNGEEIHKYDVHANRYDFTQMQNEPGKGKKTRWSRTEPVYKLHPYGIHEKELHVVYKTTTTKWDRRVRNKRENKIAFEKAKARRGHCRKSASDTVIMPEDFYDDRNSYFDDEMISDYVADECEELIPVEAYEHCKRRQISLVELCQVGQQKRRRPKKRKLHNDHSDFTEDYEEWLHSAPAECFKPQRSITRTSSLDSSGYETVDDTSDNDMERLVDRLMLPSVVIGIPKEITLRDYVLRNFQSAVCLDRLKPETFLAELNNEIIPQTSRSAPFSGFLSVRVDSTIEAEFNEHFLRVTFNEVTKILENDDCDIEQRSSNANAATSCNVARVLPNSRLAESECFNENLIRRDLVNDWLKATNEELAFDEPSCSYSSNVCGVCFDENSNGFSLYCGHYFCITCWTLNARQCLLAGIVPIRCMSTKCKAVVELDHALTFIPFNDCVKYEKVLWNKLALRDGWMYCDDCGRVMREKPSIPASKWRSMIRCECGATKCMECKNAFHAPMPCNIAQQYSDVMLSNGEDMQHVVDRQSVMLRRCPKCRICCERTAGCNHMLCRCGYEFCYACGKQFDGSHYECDKVVLQKVHLFDVRGAVTDERLQAIYEDSWVYREQRKPEAVKHIHKQLAKITSNFKKFLDIYIAAIEVLELGEATIQFLKTMPSSFLDHSATTSDMSKLNVQNRISRMSGCIVRLKFILDRFRLAIANKKSGARVEQLCAYLETITKHLVVLNLGPM